MKKYFSLTAIVVGIILTACQSKKEDIDLNSIDVNITIKRFEKDLLTINPDSIEQSIPMLHREYGKFFELFGEGIIRIGKLDDPQYNASLKSFITNKMVNDGYQRILQVFPDLSGLNLELTNAFKRYHYYFPDKLIPKIYTFTSGYNLSIALGDSLLGIGLDRYLGRDCEFYIQLGTPRYQVYNMHPKKIPSDCLRAWAIGEFPFNDSIDNLINNMIYEGQLMYMTKTLLPESADSLIFGFTPDQMKWCLNNEGQMWLHLIENKLLFSTDSFQINKMIHEAPFTSGFTQESPGRAVVWLGYRIVDSFMKNNKDVTIANVMGIRNYQMILNQSKYKP